MQWSFEYKEGEPNVKNHCCSHDTAVAGSASWQNAKHKTCNVIFCGETDPSSQLKELKEAEGQINR